MRKEIDEIIAIKN